MEYSKEKAALITEIHWELTNHCNFACAHCYLSNDSRAELSTDQIFNLLEQMHDYGILYLTLSGGEPLLRPDFELIYQKAHSMGFLINVFTNGSLITDKIVNLFSELPPQKIEITVNGITKETFEKVTLKKESFEATFSGIKKLHNAGIFLGIKTNGMTLNKDEILDIKSYFQSMPNVFLSLIRL